MIEAKQQIQKSVYKYSYLLNDILGEGYSSKVYKGIHNDTGQVVAIKVINLQTLVTPISQSLLKNEISIIKQLNHENLMKVYEAFQTRNNTYIICEFCCDGDLANILRSTNLTIKEIIDIFTQISRGVKALHDQKIIHRDIKPANILRLNGIYKLSDFGFAIVENDFESIIKKFHVGTPVYMAPETVQLNQYSEKSDIWSLGVVLYLMIFKELPFNQKKEEDIRNRQQEVYAKIRNERNLPKNIQYILIGMLEIDPQKRLSIEQILTQLQSQKKLQCTSHQNIVCKILRRSSAHEDYHSPNQFSKPLKTLPNEEIEQQIEPNSCRHYQIQHKINLYDQEFKELAKGFCSQQQTDNKIKENTKSSKRKVQIQIPIVQSNYIQKLEKPKISENSDLQQNAKSSSTNETVKNSYSSNRQVQNEYTIANTLFGNIENALIDTKDNKLSPICYTSKKKKLIDSPKRQLKTVSSYQNLLDQNTYSNTNRPFNQNNTISQQKVRTSTSVSKFQDSEKKMKIKDKPTLNQNSESLSATILPTYKFLVFLNQVLKNFDQINTEEKQKCFFLLRKLLALKANAIKKFCPLNFQETLFQWIESFEQYYLKVVPVFYTNQDRKFNQYFNNDLEQFTKGFSKQLYQNLEQVNKQLNSKDLLIIQDVINDNLKQFNDPILFARRWENGQL
ncbi:unnamed protein product (macronuclear) [Paramecium tetraurelia]|uniref:Protein kinase domain-containing protein n=1 Tax=Paramecium tetraurelia TaxID=5888 RepID=A0CYG3_PARTE|nr:uncharacterized protein GSPATT00011430001 [Paramecium tetraurelia]CAK75830.1 unnamed protein product [Paramecium tetraurelia]|eukprot:XP_001443227.1 hypothetical protein (macronuclear) [Paramecium tetraurelia strain d4-2]